MSHFAKLDENNVVLEVNALENYVLLDENGVEQEQKGIDFLVAWSGGYPYWKQTSYNKRIRKNYAGIGFVYDPIRDAFIPPKPTPDATLDEETCQWIFPADVINADFVAADSV